MPSNKSELPEHEGNRIHARHYALNGDLFVFEYFIDKDNLVNFLCRPNEQEKGFLVQFPADRLFAAAEKLKEQFKNISG